MRLIVAITGSSGVIYGIKMLECLRALKVETHLVVSQWGEKNIEIETEKSVSYVRALASACYDSKNMAASISSGSFKTDGMGIVPCSMKTLSSIANGYDDGLISRAASVCIKESRKLVLVPRETPLSKIHIENMRTLVDVGVTILPATPGFYQRPKTIDDMVAHIVGKVLDQFSISHDLYRRWSGE
jgi:4-hydroxy-3-polyprenylbenzoate decarboxylase